MFATSLRSYNPFSQPAMRPQGFGGHFKDTPPAFIEETKVDNKIERTNKPKKKKKVRKKKNISK
tara:strand:- start:325 stop:516 length:192 start_codon:yes stop_codon:yes gene_type:complete